MKITRLITYEGTLEQLARQLKMSLADGTHRPGLLTITVHTVTQDEEGNPVPELPEGVKYGWHPEIDKT